MPSERKRKVVTDPPAIPRGLCPAKTYLDPVTGKRTLGISVEEHNYIVACIALALLNILSLNRFVIKSLVTLAACHDIGKISYGFWKKIVSGVIDDRFCTRHAEISESEIYDMYPDYNRAGGSIIGAHHGSFNSEVQDSQSLRYGGPNWSKERRLGIEEMEREFGKIINEKPNRQKLINSLSVLTIADWIASDDRYFYQGGKFPSDPVALKEYKAKLKEKAYETVRNMGWERILTNSDQSFKDIFGVEPYDFQSELEKIAKKFKKPGVIIVENSTGSGKTCAALMATYSLIENGAFGFYWGSPTRMTSNAISDPILDFVKKGFKDDAILRLVHGESWQTSKAGVNELGPGGRWFSPNRRALLQQFGVGTIDQPLMGVLDVKFSYIRTFSLLKKVLIIDEVHTYDAYTGTLIQNLVKESLAMKGVVIILSATLTREAKAKLLGCKVNKISVRKGYPMITWMQNGDKKPHELCLQSSSSIEFNVNFVNNTTEARMAMILKAIEYARIGINVLWIENTVPEAALTYDQIKKLLPDKEVGLLHSRFTAPDREKKEQYWLSIMGKDAGTKRPRGSILVATQVAEQGIDVDFDILVTSLCPSDFIIQRLGRTFRHNNLRPSCLTKPEVWILSPDVKLFKDEQSLKEAFGISALVYDPFILKRTALIWRDKKTVSLPNDTRSILEHTYKGIMAKASSLDRRLHSKFVTKKDKKFLQAMAATTKTGVALSDREEMYAETDQEDTMALPDAEASVPRARKASVPTVWLVLCKKISPEIANTEFVLRDGRKIIIPNIKIDISERGSLIESSIAVAANKVRVPVTTKLRNHLNDQLETTLNNVVFGRSIAVIDDNGCLLFLNGEPTGYTYCSERGAIKTVDL